MKMKKIYYILLLLTAVMYSACEVSDPMASEQYKKMIYMVGANSKVSTFELPYGDGQNAFVSLAASGSQKTDKDVKITLKSNDELIEWYNKKYMLDKPVKYRKMGPEKIDIPSWEATLKAGELYVRFPFNINSKGLHCDSLYAITFAIDNISEYEMSEEGKELIFTVKLTNPFSGDYNMKAQNIALEEEGGQWVEASGKPVSIQRILTACSATEVRFFHENKKQKFEEFGSSWEPVKDYFDTVRDFCVKFVQIGDSNKFTVEAWDSMIIYGGEAELSFSKEGNRIFTFWYDFADGNERRRMKGTFTE